MPPLKDVTTMVTAARSRLIRFTFIIQNFAQLTQVYGKENGDTIRGNCNLVYLISSEIAALEEISKMCGEVKSKEKEKTASTPLVTVSDLQRLNKFEIIVLRRRMFPYKTRFQTDFEVDWGRTYPKSVPPVRQKKELELFDIREFVKEKKKKRWKPWEVTHSQEQLVQLHLEHQIHLWECLIHLVEDCNHLWVLMIVQKLQIQVLI